LRGLLSGRRIIRRGRVEIEKIHSQEGANKILKVQRWPILLMLS